MSENIAAATVTISDGDGNTVTVTGVGVTVPFEWTGDGTGLCYPVIIGRPPAEPIVGGWTRMKPRTPHEAQWLQRIRGLPPLRVVRSRRGRR